MQKLRVTVVMGSDSDWPVMKPAVDTLQEHGIEVDFSVVSAHRTPNKMLEFAATAKGNGYSVIIAGAGGAAHLPGMIASNTSLPVIGVPVKSKALNGYDSLLSIVQMPAGIPVATMAIDGAKNAALLAMRIMGVFDDGVAKKVEDFMRKQSAESEGKTLPPPNT